MTKRITLVWILLAGMLWHGCSDGLEEGEGKEENGNIPPSRSVSLLIAGEDRVDSAQVFFLRQLHQTDSLIYRQVIYDIGRQPQRFDFSLPAGEYTMILFGNVATSRIVFAPPYSATSISLDYNGGIEPPAIYYGRITFNAGADSSKAAALVLVTSWVELTVRSVPQGIARIGVRLQNTAAGLVIGDSYLERQMMPELSKNIEQPQEGGSYTLSFSCFPNVEKFGESTLVLVAYDEPGNLVYSGESAPFIPYPGKKRAISCTFETPVAASGAYAGDWPGDKYKLDWDYDEYIR